MKTLEYKTVDKSAWGPGPWQDEPDKAQWVDEATGLPCLMVRNHSGAWCGYVGVPPSHPAYLKDSYSLELSAHGGVNFSHSCCRTDGLAFVTWRNSMLRCVSDAVQFPNGDSANGWKKSGHLLNDFPGWQKMAEASAICHTVEPGEEDRVWWLGFDCAHVCKDLAPGLMAVLRSLKIPGTSRAHAREVYRDVPYVRAEVRELAQQLKAMA